ncbi:MAG: hypothetical protein JWM68_3816 [Verrucomicrobiales bacterium]|nr:hypothetical protein [Verrucomicrobiales bacterium]
MSKAYYLEFTLAKAPITSLVTKFGGQPVWLETPEWPVSKTTRQPMRFVCQIALSQVEALKSGPANMAYVFITDDDGSATAETWKHEGGENAVILQTGSRPFSTAGTPVGPTLERWCDAGRLSIFQKLTGGKSEKVRRECEFAVGLIAREDPVDFDNLSEADTEAGLGSKLGGTPRFIQDSEYPDDGPWQLLAQIDSCKVPFEINFGDAGVGYVFLSEDGKSAKFLWQCL